MLPPKNRLRLQKDFKHIFKKGPTINSSALLIKAIKNQKSENRFGIVVLNKISKKAVVRNKIRRRIKSWINKNNNNLKTSFDIIIITKKGILEYDFSKTKLELDKIFHKARLLK